MGDDTTRSEFKVRLGITLQRVRKALTDHTQESMADATGMNRETYGRYERGLKEPKAYDLSKIWAELNAPLDWLLDPTSDVNELDRRIADLRHERATRAAQEAAQAAAADESDQPVDGGR